MRHGKAAMVIDLARRLAASAEGLTLDDMAREMGVGRRTAERLRDAVLALFPAAEEVSDPPTKRWRIRGGLSGFEQAPTAGELIELSKTAEALDRTGEGARAAALRSLEHKIRAATRSTALNRLAPDLEALVRAETIAVQAGPRPFSDEGVIAVVRRAIMAGRALGFVYRMGSTPGRWRQVAPFGLMFGRANYLVGGDLELEGEAAASPRTFRLDGVEQIEMLDRLAGPPPGFDLAAFANRSFGIYQDEIQDVALRISPEGARDALAWRFHPTQTIERQADGSVLVRFSASGMRELAWHLFTWGDKVEVLAPESLRQELVAQLETALARHRANRVT